MGRFEGRVVFIPYALPGEELLAEITESRRDYLRANIVRILVSSPFRVEPPCRFYGRCGGCDLQHLSYPEQLKAKTALVKEAFLRIGGLSRPVPEIEASPPYGYKNRIQLHRDKVGRVGFMARRSRTLVPVDHCLVCVPRINDILSHPPKAKRRRFVAFATPEWSGVEGEGSEGTVKLLGREIVMSPSAFFQSNLAVLPAMVRYVIEGLAGASVADLYCGVGLFGRFLAESFDRVVAVDRGKELLQLARRNVPGRGHRFHQADLERGVPDLGQPEAVVVDPPRRGLSAAVRDCLLRSPVPRIVYVSCDPATLARDIAALCEGGYELESLRLFDLFPQTHHIESVARLRRME